MRNRELAKQWIVRAQSNLARAEAGKVNDAVLYEDLCFDAQQAVEKALKGLCVNKGIMFSRTHNIAYLLETISKELMLPPQINEAKILTQYAVEARYPGDYEPVTEEEYAEAFAIAKVIVEWVINEIG